MLGYDAERITMEYKSQSFRHATVGPAVDQMRFAITGCRCKSDEESVKRQAFEWESQAYCTTVSSSRIERDGKKEGNASQHPVARCRPRAIRNPSQIYHVDTTNTKGHACGTTLKLD
jgi:hypothetical protein